MVKLHLKEVRLTCGFKSSDKNCNLSLVLFAIKLSVTLNVIQWNINMYMVY